MDGILNNSSVTIYHSSVNNGQPVIGKSGSQN